MNFYLLLLSSLSHPTPYPTLGPNPNIFPIHAVSCNKLDRMQCTYTYMCGWCTNSTNCDDDDDFWNNSTNKQLFLDIEGIQMNGRHCMVSMMNHDIFYEGSVKKSKGMVLIDYDKVRSALESFL